MTAKTQTQNFKVGQVCYYCGDDFSDAGNVIIMKYRKSSRHLPVVIKYQEEGESFFSKCGHTFTFISDSISVDEADLFISKEEYILSLKRFR